MFKIPDRNKPFSFLLILFVVMSVSSAALAQEKTVEDYIKTASINSPLLKDLNNQLLTKSLDSTLIRRNYQPQAGFNSTGTYAPIVRGYGYDEALSNGTTFNALLTVNQAILGGGRLKNELRVLENLSDSIRNSVLLSRQELRRNIIAQYITAYTSQKQVELDKRVQQLLKEEDLLLKSLTRGNVYKQVDYLTFLVTLQQQELQMKQNGIEALNSLNMLNYLCGIVSTDTVKLAEPRLNPDFQKQENSIFLTQYRLDSIRIQNNRRSLAFNYRPKAGVYADAGYNSSFIDQPYKNFGASVGFTVSVPVYDGHQRRLQTSKLDIQESTRTNYRQYFLKQYEQQKALLRQELEQQQGLFQKINEQLRFIESLIKVDGKLLQTGDITIADYVLAIRNYLDVQNLLKQTNGSRLQLINQLNYWNQ
jgi:outer membrane protein TolC